jgi:hypothetical protein
MGRCQRSWEYSIGFDFVSGVRPLLLSIAGVKAVVAISFQSHFITLVEPEVVDGERWEIWDTQISLLSRDDIMTLF